MATHTVYVALGSNLGDRRANLHRAIELINALSSAIVTDQSSIIETDPVGPGEQRKYLNAVIEIRTSLRPEELLEFLLAVEQALGRVRREKWGPRTIDLDILLYDDLVLREPNLKIPHPHMQDRLFVLAPLAEIAPEVGHPVLRRSVRQLLDRLKLREADESGA